MYKLVIYLLLAFGTFQLSAQSPDCRKLELHTDKDAKTYAPCILRMAERVLAQSMNSTDKDVAEARGNILVWMEKTPDYTFHFNGEVAKMCKGDNVFLLGIYCAAMTKSALSGEKDFHDKGLKILAEYIKDPSNEVKKNKYTEKFLQAYAKGDLKAYGKGE